MNSCKSMIGISLLFAALISSCDRTDARRVAVRAPKFNYAKDKEGGCGDVFLYKGSADDLEVLWIATDKDKLKLPKSGSIKFDLATAPEGLHVAVDLWDSAPKFHAYCNDISAGDHKKTTWTATSGKLTLTFLGPVDEPGPGPKRYKVSARLEGVVFEARSGDQATLKEEAISETIVGWYAG
jgi:hypothetical protein